jgi:NAD(P)H-hydrate epimerase
MNIKTLTKAELREALVLRLPDDHKGVYGHVLIAAGSKGMAGAAILAARAALRSGVGLVTVATPSSAASIVAGAVPSAMTMGLPENPQGTLRADGVEKLKAYAKERRVTTLAIGPGLTTHPDAVKFVSHALSGLPLPAVVDADALNALSELEGAAKLLKGREQTCVFTPHPGEIARALKIDAAKVEADRAKAAERLAKEWGGVVLLKGHKTLIASGGKTLMNATGGAALAKAGSGDVLTGLIAGLWAQAIASGRVTGDLAVAAAALGAWLHGTAGDFASRELTPWAATSTDLVDYLPKAFKAL